MQESLGPILSANVSQLLRADRFQASGLETRFKLMV